MKTLMTVSTWVAWMFVGYIATMSWINVNNGKDAFADTPLEGKVDSTFAKKAVNFTSTQLKKLKKDNKNEYTSSGYTQVQENKSLEGNSDEFALGTLSNDELKFVRESNPTTEEILATLWGFGMRK